MTSRNPLHGLPAEVKARLRERAQPRWVAPMLATLTDERFSREGWLFEPKWDGERCLAFRSGGELNLFTRNRIRLNERYPEVTAAFHRQRTDSFIADGEIVTFKDGITSFTKLQERIQVEHPSADLLRRVPVSLYLFDLLYLDRYDTRQVPLRFRKQVLRNGKVDWKDSPPDKNLPKAQQVLLMVRRIRNNLFHGAKVWSPEYGNRERDTKLVEAGLVVLKQCVLLNQQVHLAYGIGAF